MFQTVLADIKTLIYLFKKILHEPKPKATNKDNMPSATTLRH